MRERKEEGLVWTKGIGDQFDLISDNGSLPSPSIGDAHVHRYIK